MTENGSKWIEYERVLWDTIAADGTRYQKIISAGPLSTICGGGGEPLHVWEAFMLREQAPGGWTIELPKL